MFQKEVYTRRRKELTKQLSDGIILFLGNTDVPMNYAANTYHWRQDSNYLYFFGLDYQNMAAVIDIDNGTEHIFGNDVTLDDIIWMGPQISTAEKAENCGVAGSYPFNKLEQVVSEARQKGRRIHFTPPYRAENKILLEQLTGIKPTEQKAAASEELIRAIVKLRSVKDQSEIEEIEKAIDTGWLMHTTAMKMARHGMKESEIAATVEGIALSAGGMLSFPAIISKHGETLHNHYHGYTLKTNDLLLLDTGAETALHYASDHTRTIPVGGKFTPRQKDIYEAVLDAVVTSTQAIKPGVPFRDIHFLAAETLAGRLKDIGLMKGDIKSAVAQGAHALFFPHGLGHMLGLDVHDMEDLGENFVGYDDEIKRSEIFGTRFLRLGRKLQPGFVLTVEPGCYFIPALIDKWKGEGKFNEFINYDVVETYRDFGGIRIEDDILVTDSGYKLLGKPIPKTVEDVESMVATG
jgi:Xaa-Pro aminopeptidase